MTHSELLCVSIPHALLSGFFGKSVCKPSNLPKADHRLMMLNHAQKHDVQWSEVIALEAYSPRQTMDQTGEGAVSQCAEE